jgi:triphosphoribosyl-dephospho-CoA synthase
MRSSPIAAADALARALVAGAGAELALTPKPGLVDRDGCGSHPDLTFGAMVRSLRLVRAFLGRVVASLEAGEPFARQVVLGRAAEAELLARLGTNTHRGFVFLAGLLVVARARCGPGEPALREAIAALATEHFATGAPSSTHGGRVRTSLGAGGVVREARLGLPALFDEGLPAFRAAIARGADRDAGSWAMLGRLMQHVEDTTALHRCGTIGLGRVRRDGVELERLVTEGEDPRPFLRRAGADWARMGLTMGGVADLIGLGFGWLRATGEWRAAREPGRAIGGRAGVAARGAVSPSRAGAR